MVVVRKRLKARESGVRPLVSRASWGYLNENHRKRGRKIPEEAGRNAIERFETESSRTRRGVGIHRNNAEKVEATDEEEGKRKKIGGHLKSG